MRIAAICLPELRVELVRNAEPVVADQAAPEAPPPEVPPRERAPLAIVVAPPPLTEAKLLGNTRLDVVSREARRLGIRPGQTIAQARAHAPSLVVRVVRPEAVRSVLARLAEVALAFGATVSFSTAHDDVVATDPYGDVVWVDVTGCAHLHGALKHRKDEGIKPVGAHDRSSSEEGEAVLASRLARVIEGLGHTCAVVVADGPRVSAILARAAAASRLEASSKPSPPRTTPRERRQMDDDDEPLVMVVPRGKNALALAPLPVSALPIESTDARWLAKIGVRTIEELRRLPRSALATRLGSRAAVVLALADGEDRAPLSPYVPPEIPEEHATFEYGATGSDVLTFVAKGLCDRLAARLAGRAVAASRLELDLALDVALMRDVEESKRPRIHRIALDLPQPLSSASDLLAALRPKIERAVVEAPVLGAKLRAPVLVRKPEAALSLFEAQPKAERALPRLVAELAADLGEEAVGKLSLGDAWTPEDRSRFVRLGAKLDVTTTSMTSPMKRNDARDARDVSGRKRRHMLASVPEPTRILAEAITVPRDAVHVVRHLSRLEAVDWWKRLPGEGPKKGVDYVYAWIDEGAAWVEIDRATGAARLRGWFD